MSIKLKTAEALEMCERARDIIVAIHQEMGQGQGQDRPEARRALLDIARYLGGHYMVWLPDVSQSIAELLND